MSEENFWRDKAFSKVFNTLKLRASYGILGHDVLIPNEVGFELPEENLNSDMRRSFDGIITWIDRVKDFNYSVSANFTYSRLYNWHQYKPRFGNTWHEYRSSESKRFGNIAWGYEADGQLQSWEEIAKYPVDIDGRGNSTLRPGDIKYKDKNSDGIINGLDERPIGYNRGSTPNLNFGINIVAEYKGFDIAMDFTGGAFGTYNINYELSRPFWDGGNSGGYILKDQWRLSDITDPNSKLIPGKYPTALTGNTNHSNYWTSDFWYTNVSYVKLKNLELGYTLPAKWASKVGMSSFRVYFFGQNLFSLDNLKDLEIDPEIISESGLNYPTNRMYGFGNDFLRVYDYGLIRNINQFLQGLRSSAADHMEPTKRKNLEGETRFLRAWTYFQMCRGLGGMPIVGDKVFEYSTGMNITSLQHARSTESDMYDYIIAECEDIIGGGKYKLYEGNPDKSVNFYEAISVKSNNTEAIWTRDHYYPGDVTFFSYHNVPTSVAEDEESASITPILNLVEAFEYTDDRNGDLKTEESNVEYIFHNKAEDLFENKDQPFSSRSETPRKWGMDR